jgi:hypothetical protein
MRWILALALCGCQGEAVSTTTADASCGSDSTNFLRNADFEEWVGTTASNWNAGTADRGDDRPEHCSHYLRFNNDCYGAVFQEFSLGTPLAAGTVLEYGAALRWIAGSSEAAKVLLKDGETILASTEHPLATDATWKTAGGTYTLPAAKGTFTLWVAFPCYAQTVGVDHAFVRVRR